MTWLALHANRATMGAHDELDNAQAETAAAGIARKAAIDLIKAAEYSFLFARGDADTVVFYGEYDTGLFAVGANGDSFFARRIFPGIVDKVAKDSDEGVFVGADQGEIGRDNDAYSERTYDPIRFATSSPIG